MFACCFAIKKWFIWLFVSIHTVATTGWLRHAAAQMYCGWNLSFLFACTVHTKSHRHTHTLHYVTLQISNLKFHSNDFGRHIQIYLFFMSLHFSHWKEKTSLVKQVLWAFAMESSKFNVVSLVPFSINVKNVHNFCKEVP